MSISCEIIKDLLPLYHYGVCSNESKRLVEEHLTHCEGCKAELQVMDEFLPINNAEQNLKEANAIKNLSKKWKKGMFKSLLKGALFTLLSVIILLFVLYLFMDIRIN
jgi:predicted anti-sigma-YlaC factor YlaD